MGICQAFCGYVSKKKKNAQKLTQLCVYIYNFVSYNIVELASSLVNDKHNEDIVLTKT